MRGRYYHSLNFFPRPFLYLATAIFLAVIRGSAQTNEFRGIWADGWHGNFSTAAEVSQIIADARSGNFNAVVVEVRRRGDAYYNGLYEPKATDISPQSYDPLADLIAKGHDTSGGKQRIEIHGWIVTFPIWNNQNTPPSQPTHPYNLHPDWLTKDNTGATWDGGNYCLDQSHPAVQQHTYNVCMDIISHYDVDGLSYDYVRYTGNTWGYNDVAVARFNARFNRTGNPAPTDSAWLQFRRDQVTALVRKVYLNAIAIKPMVKLSANTITWNPSVTSDASWTNSANAYTSVLQDWRAWMQEGILDLNTPMNYYRQVNNATDFANWSNFAKDHQYNRQCVILPGGYLNAASNAVYQLRSCRAPSPSGNTGFGVADYDYNDPCSNGVTRAAFFAGLTNGPTSFDSITPAIFSQRATPAPMPWKIAPTNGHLKGFIYGGSATNPLDGASITISGPVNRAMISDATGFYGSVDLPPGDYAVTASYSNYTAANANVTISTNVATQDLILGFLAVAPTITTQPQSQSVVVGNNTTFSVSAMGSTPLFFQWNFNGATISAATNSVYARTNAQFSDAGSYSVVVSNSLGTATSSNAVLMVVAAPPPPQFGAAWPGANGLFQCWFSGNATNTYLIDASTNLLNWFPLTTVSSGAMQWNDPMNLARRFYRGRQISVQKLTDFENFSPGATVLFQKPSFSGTTGGFIDTSAGTANFSLVTNIFPSGHVGARVLQAGWTWKAGTGTPWLRLTTSDAITLQNPTVDFRQGIQFDVFADKEIYVAVGLRETSTGAAIGADGGRGTLPIEWVGGVTDNTSYPSKGRLIPAGQWTTLSFFFPYEPIRSFTGNGILESTTGKGVFEHLAILPGSSGLGSYNLFLDNFEVIYFFQ